MSDGKVEVEWTDELWKSWRELFESSGWKALMDKAEARLGKGAGPKGLGKGKKGKSGGR